MPVQQSEMIYRHPLVVSNSTTNGGRMSAVAIADDVENNVWPNVPLSERTNGAILYRKLFLHIANDDDIPFNTPKVFMENYSPGDDNVTLFPAAHDDTQADITGSERLYGCGQLDVTVIAGATTIDVLTEDSALGIFVNGDKIRISNKTDVEAIGEEEYVTLDAAVTYTGDVAHLSFTPALANGYTAASSRVASVIEGSTIEALVSAWLESGSGTYDEAGNPLLMDSIGSVSQDWTLTFTGATTFDVVGDTAGNVGSGTTAGDFSPNNADHSKPFFTLAFAGWAGTWTIGDTITFRTDPASITWWEKRGVPAGASTLGANEVVVAVDGASA